MSKENNQTLQELTAEFDEIVAWFDQDDFDVERALEKYQQAHAIAEKIKQKLETIENKITVLKKSFDS